VLAGLVWGGGEALACSCAAGQPISERIDAADAAFVGRLLEVRGTSFVYDNDRTIKGELRERVVVTSPGSAAQCGLTRPPKDELVGLLLTRAGSGWSSSLCAQTTAGELLSVDDDLPGQRIRLAVGVVILFAVLGYSLLRLRRRRQRELGAH
jgi:hypothetical protein